ncbi:sphingosine-1-phosphate phosphatase 1-like [Chironomus tepperi]|uniref:sphingosine-1-phosphate phosphatase 1-like n=1 Tax=Chironomus tepperi TaxID=113505 RepID=UPI00391FC9D3
MSKIWNYLNSPELVYKVQNFFGLERTKDDKIIIKNKFFYYLFIIGTELGDELFYGIFIPMCFFNLDGFIGRRFVFNWFINMYVGQALKEFFLTERPKAPAIKMQKKFSNEYSLPSTHAMSSPSIAVTIVYFALERYDVNLTICAILTVIWISVVSWSRVYLGMHSVLDLVLGFFLSAVLLTVVLPITNTIELFLATNVFSPIVLLTVTITAMVYFPRPSTRIFTRTKGDTTSIAAVFVGIELGHWLNYQMGYLDDSQVVLPLAVEFNNILNFIMRTVIGLLIAAASEFIGKLVAYSSLCAYYGEDKKKLKETPDSIDNTKKNFIDLTTNFLTYSFLGFCTLFVVHHIYSYFNIQRTSFYTEI